MKRIILTIVFIPLGLIWALPGDFYYSHLSFIQPLEISLGNYYLYSKQNIKNQSFLHTDHNKIRLDHDLQLAYFFFLQSQNLHPIHPSSSLQKFEPTPLLSYQTYLPLSTFHTYQYYKSNFLELELIPYFTLQSFPWKHTTKKLNIRYAISYGLQLNQKETFAAFLGFINEQKVYNQLWSTKEPFVEYGKIFFTPGIQLRSQSLVLKTFLEMPLYSYNWIQKTQKLYTINKDNIKANFQIQIRH